MNRNNSIISKKNVGKNENDLYRTPHFCTKLLFDYHLKNYRQLNIIDPCAGYGDILIECEKYKNVSSVIGNDIFPHSDIVKKGDVFDLSEHDLHSKVIITNPPFSAIDGFLEHFFKYPTWRRMCLFLPVEYISVQKRRHWYERLRYFYPFDLRMNLTEWRGGDKVDFGATTYAWYVFSTEGSFDNEIKMKLISSVDYTYRRGKS